MSDHKSSHNLEIEKDHSSAADLDTHPKVPTLVPHTNAPTGKKERHLYFLIIPTFLVVGMVALLIAMIAWLVTSQRQPFGAPAYVTHSALVVDESSRWCQIRKKVLRSATCGSALEPSLLGLTLSGLLVRIAHLQHSGRI